MEEDKIVCKMIFEHGKMSESSLQELLKQYTEDFSIVHFYPTTKIGCNKRTAAIVEISPTIVPQVYKTKLMTVELIDDNEMKGSNSSCGGCGCGSGKCRN